MTDPAAETELTRDLEQRIDTLQHLDEEVLGTLTRLDWALLVVGAVVLPALFLIVAA